MPPLHFASSPAYRSSPPPSDFARFWGVRGSIPTPGPSTARYGGNTTCLELRIQGRIIIIDAGSGIRPLGAALMAEFGDQPLSLTLLNTHTHWDHIQGFPFFLPAYGKGNRIQVFGRDPSPAALPSLFQTQMDGSHFFPVPLEAMTCELEFHHLNPAGEGDFLLDGVGLATCPTNHPGGCLAYRLNTPGQSLVFLSDHETEGDDEERILQFIDGSDILIADAQYTTEEFESRKGWGHGSPRGVVSTALRANVRNLYMTHHDPSHDDHFLDNMLAEARGLVPGSASLKVFAARENEVIPLS
ncbi:MAG: MBL fold metallo-hydrolase [bacterium]